MNPRQRRGALLIGLSVIGAVAVFFAVSGYVADVRSQVGPLGPVVRLVDPLEPFQPITPELLRTEQVPLRWRDPQAVTSATEVLRMVSATRLPAETVLQTGMLIPPPEVGAGLRQLAITVDAEAGVGGNIGIGSRVDIIATRAEGDSGVPSAEIVIQDAEILSIGTRTTTESQSPAGAFVRNEVVPVTFALPPSDILRLAWVEQFAASVRLALRSPTDPALLAPEQRVFAPVPDIPGGGS